MKTTFDPAKRAATLAHRGLDFADAEKVFEGDHATWPDDRRDYGESRYIISMRHCHAKEERKIRRRFEL